MAEGLKFATPEAEPPKALTRAGGFVMTHTAADIQRSVDLIRSIDGPAMTMISGAPGVGKSATLREITRKLGDDAVYVTIAKGEGNPSNVATAILSLWSYNDMRGHDLTTIRQTLGLLIGPRRVLMVDEAQFLFQRHKASCTKGAAFDWLRVASEESGFDLVFCGDLTLQAVMMNFRQLQSRMRRPVKIKEVDRADVEALAAANGLQEREIVTALAAVAEKNGGLRNVENVIRNAELFAGGGAVTGQHVKAAIIDLKLAAQDGRQ